jgi:mRNA interferase YafQ
MTMLGFETTTKFRKDYKRIEKRKYDLSLMDQVVQALLEEKPLDPVYCDHALTGDYAGHRECHILSDWLFIYRVDKGRLVLVATRTGTHYDLF